MWFLSICLSTVPVELSAALLDACSVPARFLCEACEVSLAWICIRSIMWCCRASSKMCDLDSSGCNPQWWDLCCCCWWGNTTQCCQVSLSISLLFLLSGELNCRAHGWCSDSVQWVWPLTSAWASGEMRVCVLHKLCIYELLNWFPLLQIKALVFALYWRQGKPSRKQTALLVLERTKSPIARN